MASASTTSTSDGKNYLQRRESYDTVCSSRNSSCFLQKRKQAHPLANSIRLQVPRSSTNNAVKQRVSSARLLKLRSLQSQLNDANFHLAELQQENRALKNLQTRQDKALSKYEGTHAELPRLLKAHEEETRTLIAKIKTLRKNLKDVTDLLKTKEDELTHSREQIKTLQGLVKNKNLGERQALTEQVEDLKHKLKSTEEQVDLLNRKIALEAKSFKHKLNELSTKNKRTVRELTAALIEMDKLGSVKNEVRFANRSPGSSETGKKAIKFSMGENQSMEIPFKNNVCTKLELEPLVSSNDVARVTNDIMSSPSDNIKARLSSGSNKDNDTDENDSLPDVNLSKPTQIRSRPNSSHKLDKLILKTASMKINDEADQQLTDFCNTALSTVKDCSKIVDLHVNDFNNAKSDTELLLENLRETDSLNSKLRLSDFMETRFDDEEIAKEIWQEEYAFRNHMKRSDKNGNVVTKEITKAALENKNKLLATLKAIDNGDEVDDTSCLTATGRRNEILAGINK